MIRPAERHRPPGGYFWGIDCSTKYAAFGVTGNGRFQANRCALRHEEPVEAERLHITRKRVHDFTQALAQHFPPFMCYVEWPTGKATNPPLTSAAVVTFLAVYEALWSVNPFPVSVLWVPVAHWKKRAVGFGNASKEQTLAWARERGYKGDSLDESDSLGIAECCRLDCEREAA